MIGTVLACLVAYAAGAFAAPAAGWEGIRLAYSGGAGPLARTLLIAAVEAFVGFGTAALGVGLAVWTPRADTLTLVAASAVGLGLGAARSLKTARSAALAGAAAREAGAPEAEVGATLRGVVRYAVLIRALAALTVPLAAAALAAG